MKRKILVIVEASKTGFGVYSDDLPGVTGYGKTIDEAKDDLKSAIRDLIESYQEDGEPLPKWLTGDFTFEYQYDLVSLFDYFGIFDISALARKIGINPSLMRQYRSGLTTSISKKQKLKIEKGLHKIGEDLLSVRL